jgi:hypothetical protein
VADVARETPISTTGLPPVAPTLSPTLAAARARRSIRGQLAVRGGGSGAASAEIPFRTHDLRLSQTVIEFSTSQETI